MFGGLNIGELVLILIIALVVFGPSKLPQLGKALGSGLKEFKNATRELTSSDEPKPEEKK